VRLIKSTVILCLVALTIHVNNLSGQQVFQNAVYRVTEIELSGNTSFSDNELLREMNLHAGKLLTFGRGAKFNKRVMQLDEITLTTFYGRRGYINCAVTDSLVVTDNRKVHLFLFIDEGQQYTLNSIRFEGNQLFTNAELMSEFEELEIGAPFDPYAFRDALDRVEIRYEDNGKPFRNISSQLNIQGSQIIADVQIEENQTVTINEIRMQGLENIRDNVVRREILLTPGDRYNREELRESQRRIFETGLFSDVTINPVASSSDSQQVDLVVSLRNMDFRTIQFDLGASQYETQTNAEITALEASAGWIHRNLMARARRLSFSASGRVYINDLTSLDLTFLPSGEISYTEPWLWNLRIPTTLRLYYDYNLFTNLSDRIYQWGADLTFLRSPQRRRLIYRAALRFQETVIPKSITPSLMVINRSIRGQERSLEFLFRKDQRDNFLYPTQGYFIEVEPQFFVDILGGTSEFYRIELTLSNYWNLFGTASLAGRVELGSMHYYDGKNGFIPEYELFYLGGPSSVRGFATDRLKSTEVITNSEPPDTTSVPVGDKVKLLANLEFRFPLIWKFGGEIFLDAGQLWPDYSSLHLMTMRYTAGAGITFATPLGPIRVDFGRKLGPLEPGEKPWVTHLALQYAF